MFALVPYRWKWLLVKYGPRLEWTVSLPFGGRVRCNFLQQRIYPGRLTEKDTRHEWVILRHYARTVYPGAVFFDIGANIGLHTAAVGHQMRLRGGAGRIVAFEPEPAVHGLLSKTIAINRLEDLVRVVPFAVSERSGRAVFSRDFYSTATGCLTSVGATTFGHSISGQPASTIEVATVSIDDWCASNDAAPTLVKIDVEGAEDLVLQGMSEIIARHQPDIIIDGCTEKAAWRLKDAGYRLCSLDTEDGRPVELTKLEFTVFAFHGEHGRSTPSPIR